MSPETEEARAYLTHQGYEVCVETRDLHAAFMARGEPGRASFYAAGSEYYCVDLVRDGVVAWPEIGVGETEAAALLNAKRWFVR